MNITCENLTEEEQKLLSEFTKPQQRDEKGKFLPGNTESVGNAGKPCFYCRDKDTVLAKVQLYNEWTKGNLPGNKGKHMPWLEDLCDEEYLDISEDTLTDWWKSEHSRQHHSELIRSLERIFTRQKGLLKKGVIGGKHPAGFIFLLEANHGQIRSEKQIIAGSTNKDEELVIKIIEEEKPRYE